MSDDELRSMVGSSQYERWAQEIAVELLGARGHNVELPPPPPPSAPRPSRPFPWRRLLAVLGGAAAVSASVAAYFAFTKHRRDERARPVREWVERLLAVEQTLPALRVARGGPRDATPDFGSACAGVVAKIGWKQIIGFTVAPNSASSPEKTRGLPRWTLVAARHEFDPASLDEADLDPERIAQHLKDDDVRDDGWYTRLPQPDEIRRFRYAAIARVSDIAFPHITKVTLTGAESKPTFFGPSKEVDVEGDLGHANVDITVVELETQAVVCAGRIENVHPKGFGTLGVGRNQGSALRNALDQETIDICALIGLTRAIDRAWLAALCPSPWPDVCPAPGEESFP